MVLFDVADLPECAKNGVSIVDKARDRDRMIFQRRVQDTVVLHGLLTLKLVSADGVHERRDCLLVVAGVQSFHALVDAVGAAGVGDHAGFHGFLAVVIGLGVMGQLHGDGMGFLGFVASIEKVELDRVEGGGLIGVAFDGGLEDGEAVGGVGGVEAYVVEVELFGWRGGDIARFGGGRRVGRGGG